MTKKELTQEVSAKTGIPQLQVEAVVLQLFDTIKQTLLTDEEIFIRGFATFQIKERQAMIARDINKNTSLLVPSCKVPKVKFCKEFKQKFK